MSPAIPLGYRTALLGLLVFLLVPSARSQSVDEGAAQVLAASGQVSVYRDGALWALFQGQAVGVGETIVTEEDGFAELQLSDGSQFFVFPNSHVVFRKNPGSWLDLVDVVLGRVKLQLQRMTGQDRRYRIFTPTAVISVRGTTFDVSVDEDETTLILVEDGLVGVTHRLLPSNNEIPVGAGESLVVYRNVPLAKAGIDKVRALRLAGNVARTVAYIWSRIGTGGGGSTPAGGVPGGSPGGGLPGDTPAPEPPSPPPVPGP